MDDMTPRPLVATPAPDTFVTDHGRPVSYRVPTRLAGVGGDTRPTWAVDTWRRWGDGEPYAGPWMRHADGHAHPMTTTDAAMFISTAYPVTALN